MKQPVDTVTPELHLDGQPVFAFDVDRDDCEWPMPPTRLWAPVELSPQAQELLDIMDDAKRRAESICGLPPEAIQSENWGTSIVATPEYKAEQARRNAELREELEVRSRPHDPAAEPNPIAAAFTRLMTWSQR